MIYVYSREYASAHLPPKDEPWLLSSQKDIDKDEEERQEFIEEWLKELPYPGNASSKQAKTIWFQKLKDKHTEEEGDTLCETKAPEAFELVRDVLLQMAPTSLVVEFCVSKTLLESMEDLDSEKDRAQFASNLSKYARKGYTGERTWSAYKRWLLEVDQPQTTTTTTTTTSTRTQLVTFGQMICGSDDGLEEKFDDFARNLGMIKFQYSIQQPVVAERGCDWHLYGLCKKIGENMYYALPDRKKDASSRVGFMVEMVWKSKVTETDRAQEEFRSKLKEMQRASLATDNPKMYFLVPRDVDRFCSGPPASSEQNQTTDNHNKENQDGGDDENIPVTAEHYHVLWLPRDYLQHKQRIQDHLDWGKGECVEMQRRVQLQRGHVMIQMMHSELTALKQRHLGRKKKASSSDSASFGPKFCAILALTEVAALNNLWMRDDSTAQYRVAKLISKDLATYWRMSVLKRDDQALGIGLGNEQQQVSSPEELSESRKALHAFLQIFAKRFQHGGRYYAKEVTFNWEVGHSRNPKGPNGMNKRQKVVA